MENVLLVDETDKVIGEEEKVKCHLGNGKLHRAVSLFLFDEHGKMIIQKRSKEKMLWPGFWTNACCTHTRKDESYEAAGKRRAKEELGISCEPKMVDKLVYHARFKNIGSEHELTAILVAKHGGQIKPNHSEISEVRAIEVKKLLAEVKGNPESFTPWFIKALEILSRKGLI